MAISNATGSSSGRSGRRSEVRKLNMSGGDLALITERERDTFFNLLFTRNESKVKDFQSTKSSVVAKIKF